jgi:prepilin signal peptidase PulO-like enzyme (type II secretory pathway)
MVSILVALAAYDIRHTILPDLWVYSFAAVALAVGILSLPSGATAPDVAALFFAGLFLALPIAALWFVSNGEWIGLGDAKLMIGIGWLLGPTAGFHALVGAFVIGAVVSLAVLVPLPSYRRVWRKVMHATSLSANGAHFTMKSEVPFGPFLIASCLIVWFLEAHGVTVQYAAFNILY